ncbi:MAG TPA: hypothetical protein VLN49_05720 [Gemmatimonadaceae bacterium]|nr:hypothetical protein [Gemmatimonadaceae bacterium]
MNALHALLAAIVDYAGLFPPAGLDMTRAVRNYAEYRASDDAWMLGRFVVPVARLDEFDAARAMVSDESEWHLAALLGDDVAGDVARAAAFNERRDCGAVIDAIECRVASPDDVVTLAALPIADFRVFAELPAGGDPGPFLAVLRTAGLGAKVRTGGVTRDSFPSSAWLVSFIRCSIEAEVAFKATAGLHHPVRGLYRLTYAEHAPVGNMYGYLNLFLAAALMAGGGSERDAAAILAERDRGAFSLLPTGIGWRGHSIGTPAIRMTRDRVAISFGSCSFEEPVDELRSIAGLQ